MWSTFHIVILRSAFGYISISICLLDKAGQNWNDMIHRSFSSLTNNKKQKNHIPYFNILSSNGDGNTATIWSCNRHPHYFLYCNILPNKSFITNKTPTDFPIQLSIPVLFVFLECQLLHLFTFCRSLISRSPFRFITVYVFLILCISALDASDDPREDIDASFPSSNLEKNSASLMCLCTWSSKTLITSSSLLTGSAPVLVIKKKVISCVVLEGTIFWVYELRISF